MGIGAALIFLPTSAVITQHFVSNRALAMVSKLYVPSGTIQMLIY